MTSPISPNIARTAPAGRGTTAGRRNTRPSVLTNSRLVSGDGLVTFSAPSMVSAKSRPVTMPTRSSRLIQLSHCLPEPNGPPAPARKAGSMRPSAPPAAVSTTPKRMGTTLMPARLVAASGASHSRQTSARKSEPGAAASVSTASPRSPP